MKSLGQIWQGVLDFFWPPKCVGCGKEEGFFCEECAGKIVTLKKQMCPVCGKLSAKGAVHEWCRAGRSLDGMLVLAGYHNNPGLRRAITKFKYESVKHAAPVLGKMLGGLLEREGMRGVVLVSVPLHYRRRWWRGFNQAEELTKATGEGAKNVLKRVRYTRPQVKMPDRESRLQNLVGVFKVWGEVEKDRVYVLVDDVSSTGATLEDCARALKKAGVKKVWAMVLAKG